MSNRDYQESDPEELARLSLERINHEIGRCLYGYESGGSAQGRKSFFKRLVLLESVRESAHGIPAKRRRFND
jgi:hypothetical protein